MIHIAIPMSFVITPKKLGKLYSHLEFVCLKLNNHIAYLESNVGKLVAKVMKFVLPWAATASKQKL